MRPRIKGDERGPAFGRNQDFLSLRRQERQEDQAGHPLSLGDLCVSARDIILAVIEAYIVRSGLSENAFRLLRASNADTDFVIPAKAGIQVFQPRNTGTTERTAGRRR